MEERRLARDRNNWIQDNKGEESLWTNYNKRRSFVVAAGRHFPCFIWQKYYTNYCVPLVHATRRIVRDLVTRVPHN